MTCVLTVRFDYVFNGRPTTEVISYSVPDGSYISPYKQNRPDLGYNGTTNKVYSVLVNGSQGVINLATYYPGSTDVAITSATNSCPPPALQYDCINGACIEKTRYSTPGIYASLSECQAQCGGSKCNGVCVPNSDWAQIQGLSNQLLNKNCS